MTDDRTGKLRDLKAALARIAERHGFEPGSFMVDLSDENSESLMFTFRIDPTLLSENEDQEQINDIFEELVADIQPTVSPKMDMYEEFLRDEDDDL